MSLRRNVHLKDHVTVSVVSSLKLSQLDGRLMFMLADHARVFAKTARSYRSNCRELVRRILQ